MNMANQVVEATGFDINQMPAHVAAFQEDPTNSNIKDKDTVPSLSPAGRKWTTILEGEKTLLQGKNKEGDDVPIPVLRVAVIDYAKARGRSYYAGAYDADNIKAPDCWSNDGRLPDASIAEPISKKCDGCPMAAKGSRISDNNKATVACGTHLMLAVVPANNLDHVPMRLKLAITSIWDKDNKEQQAKGWYAWDQYVDFLRSRQIKNTGSLITKMKFDPAPDYPKILFSAAGWFSPEQFAKIIDLSKTDDVKHLLTRSWAQKDAPTDKAPAEALKEKAGPAAATADDDDDEGQTVIPPATPEPKADKAKQVVQLDPKRAAAIKAAEARAALAKAQLEAAEAEAAAAGAATTDDDDDEGGVVETQAPAPDPKPTPAKAKANGKDKAAAKAPAPAAAPTAVPAGVNDLLSTWGEE
jgi:hypothetical protein